MNTHPHFPQANTTCVPGPIGSMANPASWGGTVIASGI
jgi:hypothetical protein